MGTCSLTLRRTAQTLRAHRTMWVPFAVVAVVELLLLSFAWLAPHPPFSVLLAPPVRFLFGDRVLHYPWHLGFLYHVMPHAHVAVSFAVGAAMTGLVCALVRQAHEGCRLSVRTVLAGRAMRYRTLLLIAVGAWLLAKAVSSLVAALVHEAGWQLIAQLVAVIFLQALLVYAIPIAVYERAAWWRALWLSAREALRHHVTTLLLVLIPAAALATFAVVASERQVAYWMARTTPEIVFLFIAGRLALWTVADALLTVAVAHLWWIHHPATSGGATPG